jgi:hypothetical protein
VDRPATGERLAKGDRLLGQIAQPHPVNLRGPRHKSSGCRPSPSPSYGSTVPLPGYSSTLSYSQVRSKYR